MGKPSAPKPPDPADTIRAQSSANMSGAMANNAMSMVNQYTPQGNLEYSQRGQQFIPDENGQTYWQGPNGEIRASAPMVTTQGGGGERKITGYENVAVGQNQHGEDKYERRPIYSNTGGGTSQSPAEGWSKTQGFYAPQYSATQTLSPTGQQIFDNTQQAGISLSGAASSLARNLAQSQANPFSLDSLPDAGTVPGSRNYERASYLPEMTDSFDRGGDVRMSYGDDYSAERQRVEDALFSRLDRSIGQDQTALDTRLANQGIRIGSEAYTRANQDFGQNVNDARTAAILGAGQEHSRLANLEAQRAGFENAAQQQAFGQNAALASFGNASRQQDFSNQNANMAQRNAIEQLMFGEGMNRFNAQNALRSQGMNEAFAVRNQPINEISALLGQSQVQQPNFVNTPVSNMPTTDAAGIINNAYAQQAANYQAQQAASGNLWGNLIGAAGTIGGGMIAGPWGASAGAQLGRAG